MICKKLIAFALFSLLVITHVTAQTIGTYHSDAGDYSVTLAKSSSDYCVMVATRGTKGNDIMPWMLIEAKDIPDFISSLKEAKSNYSFFLQYVKEGNRKGRTINPDVIFPRVKVKWTEYGREIVSVDHSLTPMLRVTDSGSCYFALLGRGSISSSDANRIEYVIKLSTEDMIDGLINILSSSISSMAKGRGSAKARLDGTNEVDVDWVQLWENGPKFASSINVGAAKVDYVSSTMQMDKRYVGNYYFWTEGTDSDNTDSIDVMTSLRFVSDGNDAAAALWGDNWRIPSIEEIKELTEREDIEWEWCDGTNKQYYRGYVIPGWKISGGKNTEYSNNSIFLPAAGEVELIVQPIEASLFGRNGYYASSSKTEYLFIDSNTHEVKAANRSIDVGFCIRPVLVQ